MNAVNRRREVILDFHGVRAIMQVNSSYPMINLPKKHLGFYLKDNTLSEDSDDDVRFSPSGSTAVLDGKTLDLWTAR